MSEYTKALGARLRSIRSQQGLSLHGVEEKSRGRWKAVVVGSYERGDRNVTVERLAELAEFYGVPASELLPATRATPVAAARRAAPPRHRPRAALDRLPLTRPPPCPGTPRPSRVSAVTTTAGSCRSGRRTCVRSPSSTTTLPAG